MTKTKPVKPVYAWTIVYNGEIWPAWTVDAGRRNHERIWDELRNLTGLTHKRAIKKDGYDVIRVKVQPVEPKKRSAKLRKQLKFPWED